MTKRQQAKIKTHARNVARGLLRRGASKDVCAIVQWDIINTDPEDPFICAYCEERVPAHKVSVDHKRAVARGGSHDGDNFAYCCKPCNRWKGPLNADEFTRLKALLDALPEEARRDIRRRMIAGGRVYRG